MKIEKESSYSVSNSSYCVSRLFQKGLWKYYHDGCPHFEDCQQILNTPKWSRSIAFLYM